MTFCSGGSRPHCNLLHSPFHTSLFSITLHHLSHLGGYLVGLRCDSTCLPGAKLGLTSSSVSTAEIPCCTRGRSAKQRAPALYCGAIRIRSGPSNASFRLLPSSLPGFASQGIQCGSGRLVIPTTYSRASSRRTGFSNANVSAAVRSSVTFVCWASRAKTPAVIPRLRHWAGALAFQTWLQSGARSLGKVCRSQCGSAAGRSARRSAILGRPSQCRLAEVDCAYRKYRNE